MPPATKSSLRALAGLAVLGAIAYLLISLVGYSYELNLGQGLSPFAMLGDFRNPFGDMKWILSYADCGVSPFMAIQKGLKCHGYSTPEYPPLFFWLGWRLGLSPEDASWISLLSATLNIGLIYFLAKKLIANVTLRWIILCFLYLSFPYQGLLSTANLDSTIFLIVVLSSLLVSLRSSLAWLSPLLALLSIGLKIYPLFGFSALLLFLVVRWRVPPQAKRNIFVWLYIVSVSAVSIATLATLIEPVTQFVNGSLGSHGLMASGYINNTLITAFGIEPARLMIRSLIILKASIFVVSLVWFGKIYNVRSTSHELPFAALLNSPRWRPVLITTAAISICCYVFSIGYDYRLIYIFPAAMLTAAECTNPRLRVGLRGIMKAQLGAIVYIFYLPFLGYHAANPLLSRIPQWLMTTLELVDEFMLSPFLFGSILVLVIILVTNPPTLHSYSGDT